MKLVSIVVPCYNEEKVLPLLVLYLERKKTEQKNVHNVRGEVWILKL